MGCGSKAANDSLGSGRQKAVERKSKRIHSKEIQILPYTCMREGVSWFLRCLTSEKIIFQHSNTKCLLPTRLCSFECKQAFYNILSVFGETDGGTVLPAVPGIIPLAQ